MLLSILALSVLASYAAPSQPLEEAFGVPLGKQISKVPDGWVWSERSGAWFLLEHDFYDSITARPGEDGTILRISASKQYKVGEPDERFAECRSDSLAVKQMLKDKYSLNEGAEITPEAEAIVDRVFGKYPGVLKSATLIDSATGREVEVACANGVIANGDREVSFGVTYSLGLIERVSYMQG